MTSLSQQLELRNREIVTESTADFGRVIGQSKAGAFNIESLSSLRTKTGDDNAVWKFHVRYSDLPHQGETPAIPVAPEAVKSAVAPRNPLNDPKSPCYGSALEPKCPAPIRSIPVAVGGAETAGVVLSVEDRMERLREKLSASGRLVKTPSPQPIEARHVRLPHPND